ncbi:MAG: hypothetical protein LBJ46_02070 [Planctomycetota bacterium]|jgi:hypothetical protein|nr:hypothetical protein [Planctomycetota bacterium]
MYVFFILVIFSALYLPYVMKMIKKKREESEEFAMANPTAAKIYTKIGLASLYSGEQVMVTEVNGTNPTMFYDGIKEGQGFFAMPGKNVVEMEYARTRPGILYKSVTTTTGPSKQELEIEAGKRYSLSFNRDEGRFVLAEL